MSSRSQRKAVEQAVEQHSLESKSGYSINDGTLVTFLNHLGFSAWKSDTNSIYFIRCFCLLKVMAHKMLSTDPDRRIL